LAHKIKASIKDKKKRKGLFPKAIFVKNDEDLLKKEIETIGDLLQEYGESASVFRMGGLAKSIGKGMSSVDIEKKKDRIEKILERLKRRLVVFIDDIDRLDKNEIYSIFKIVKLTGDFKYMTYILSFDKDMVASSIGQRFGSGDNNEGHSFLEKVIQVHLKIPKAQKTAIKNFVFKIINSTIEESKIDFSENDAQRFFNLFSSHILHKITTPRHAIIYGNSLQFVLPALKGEINYVDLMLIEAVKIFYSDVYKFIELNSNIFLDQYTSIFNATRDEPKIQKVKTQIDEVFNTYTGQDKLGIYNLTKALFPQLEQIFGNTFYEKESSNEWYLDKRICSVKYFNRYFTFVIPVKDIPDVEFEQIINRVDELSIKDLSRKIMNVIEEANTQELLTKFRSREKLYSWNQAKQISRALALIGDKFPGKTTDFYFGFSSPLSEAGIFISHLVNLGPTVEDKLVLAEQLMIEANTFEFTYEINRKLRSNKEGKQIFSIEGYQKLARILINRALEEAGNSPIFETHEDYIAYIIASWSEIDRPELLKYIKSIIDKDKSKVKTLLKACTPTMTTSGHSQPFKSDFSQEQFNWMKRALDIEYLYKIVIELEQGEVEIADVIFNGMEPNPGVENIVKQFVHWYKKDKSNVKISKNR